MDLTTLYWAQNAGRATREQFGHEAAGRAVRPRRPAGDDEWTGRAVRRIVRGLG